MRVSPPQLNFAAGELTPLLDGRADYARYATGLALCRGHIPLTQGGTTRMPGTEYLGTTRNDNTARLVPFVFSELDYYALEFTNLRMRVWRDGALVMDGANPFDIATPFAVTDLENLQWMRSGDVLTLTDGVHPPQRLERRANDDWVIADEVFLGGPFRTANADDGLAITANADSGSVTLTATGGDVFEAGHVGSLFRLTAIDQPVQAIKAGEDVIVGDRRHNAGNTYEATVAGDTQVAPVHEEGSVAGGSGEPTWEFISSNAGSVKITAVASATSATATVIETLPAGVVTGTINGVLYTKSTTDWAEGAWSEKHGYPRAVTRHEQRAVYGGTPSDPETLHFAATGSFTDFSPGSDQDDAFSVRADVDDTDLIIIETLVSSGRRLTVGGFGAVLVTTTPKESSFGIETISFDVASGRGVRRVPFALIDGDPAFVPRLGRSVNLLSYSFERDSDGTTDITKQASHLLTPAVSELAWQFAPWPVLWTRTTAGALVGICIDRAEQVLGFCTAPVQGNIESICVQPTVAGEQTIYMVVERVIGTETKRFVERMARPFALFAGRDGEGESFDIAEAWHVEAGKKFIGVKQESFSGLEHLEGHEVVIWSRLGPYKAIVTGGVATLPDGLTTSEATVGLEGPEPEWRSLDIVAGAEDGGSQGRRKRIRKVAVRLKDTVTGEARVRSRDEKGRWTVGDWRPLAPTDAPFTISERFSGSLDVAPISSGWGVEVAIDLRPAAGAPMTVLGITPTMFTADN